tara:strand:- start:188 stop:355 length:168 start_codon:yes stop_codon:yes gene_type:complete
MNGENIKKLLEDKDQRKAIINDAYMNGEIEDKQYIEEMNAIDGIQLMNGELLQSP